MNYLDFGVNKEVLRISSSSPHGDGSPNLFQVHFTITQLPLPSLGYIVH